MSLTNARKFILSLSGMMALTTGIAAVGCEAVWQAAEAQEIRSINARVIAFNIPGASAISQVGTFLNVPPPGACANPIPSKFPTYIQPGAVLDPNRILVGSRSNFGAPLAIGAGAEGSFLSIDPSAPGILRVLPPSPRAALSPQLLAAPCRCSAQTVPTGTTPSTISVRIPPPTRE
jgi:hypothetical protein